MRCDIYSTLRPLLFCFDAEFAHHMAIIALKYGLLPKAKSVDDPVLHTRVCGLDFKNPIGLAAGFDKQAEAIQGVLDLGFGFVELGTVVPQPQIGNPKPRLFRIPEAQAVLNRFGFNSDGQEKVLRRVYAYYEKHKEPHAPVGVNVGKNKNSEDLAEDFVRGVRAFAPHADYLAVNISSPNTPGLRDLQRRALLAELLKLVIAARAESKKKPPLFVKIAPDQADEQLQDIVDVSLETGIDGIIVSNTTMTRPDAIPAAMAKEAGGISGKPLLEMSTRILGETYKLTKGKIPLIGSGGVFTGADAYAKIRAGASLVQIYTAMVYEGPYVVPRIAAELAALLKRDGFASVGDAVGAAHK